MDTKEIELKFIHDFANITLTNICNDFGIDKSNLSNGRTSEKNIKKAVKEIKRQLYFLLLEDSNRRKKF